MNSFTLWEQVMLQTREVYLEDEVGLCVHVMHDLDMLAAINTDDITLYITSMGGGVPDGIQLIRVIESIQARGIKVIGVVRGEAASMAFLILQACAERRMGRFDILMAHGITSLMLGDSKDFKSQSKVLSFWREKFASFLAERTGESINYWNTILEDNTPRYFTPEEALELQLIDIVE